MKTILTISVILVSIAVKAQSAREYAVELQAKVYESPPSIALSWPLNTDTASKGYRVFRKQKKDTLWNEISFLQGDAVQYVDTNVNIGNNYEYYLRRIYTKPTRVSHGYIFAGIRSPEISYKGKMLLLVDNNYALPLVTEIEQLKMDLIADGWQVKRFDIARTETVTSVKEHILKEYNADSNTRAVYLLGHIPVPYSGGFVFPSLADYPPDAHAEHAGAWPADVYYASMDEKLWTDVLINNVSGSRTQNHNVPGDGKFDRSHLYPYRLQLQVGRVDLTDMPIFGNDTLLTKRYLKRAHEYKRGLLEINKRAIITDNLGVFNGEAFAAAGWRNFSTMFGDSVFSDNYFPAVTRGNYQFAFGCGAGSYTNCSGVASSGSFNDTTVNVIFTTLFGSYFGDWDSQNNFLKAPLCAPNPVLASMWNGRPHWHLHHMSLGENIGYSAQLTQSNSYLFGGANRQGYYNGLAGTFIHIALMGDPSLRLHPIKTAGSLKTSIAADSTSVKLVWQKSADATEYLILKSSSLDGKFLPVTKLNGNQISYTDKNPGNGMNYYMVRAMRLENTPSGTYKNLSLGIIDSVFFQPISPLSGFEVNIFPNPTSGKFTVSLKNWNNKTAKVIIYDFTGRWLFSTTVSKLHPGIFLNKVTRDFYIVKIIQGENIVAKKLLLKY